MPWGLPKISRFLGSTDKRYMEGGGIRRLTNASEGGNVRHRPREKVIMTYTAWGTKVWHPLPILVCNFFPLGLAHWIVGCERQFDQASMTRPKSAHRCHPKDEREWYAKEGKNLLAFVTQRICTDYENRWDGISDGSDQILEASTHNKQ